jgi:hypothetical protein
MEIEKDKKMIERITKKEDIEKPKPKKKLFQIFEVQAKQSKPKKKVMRKSKSY